MQPVNVLPTFVSQDTDLKTKESSDSSEGRNKDAEFSRLVDKHVDDEYMATTDKEAKSSIEAETANSGKAIAINGKNDTDAQNARQESDSQKDIAVNKVDKSDDKAVERLAKESEANQTSKDDLTDSKALDESEQFISMLYNSDQTLTNTDDKTKPSEQANQVGNTQNTQVNYASNNKIDVLDGMARNKKSAANTDESNLANEGKNSSLLTEHKLKAFSKDELLARTQLKGSNAFAQQSSEQVLKDYQQLLQSTQGAIKSQSITSEQLSYSLHTNRPIANAKLESTQLQGNKIVDLAATVTQETKGLLKEQVDTGLYQLPVEPIGKDKQSIDELVISGKGAGVKGSDSEKSALLSTKTTADVKSQLAAEINEESINSKTKVANSTAELAMKGINSEVKDNSPLNKNNVEKYNTERTAKSEVIGEAITREQPLGTQTKQPAMSSAQVQTFQQLQAQQKEQAVNTDSQSVEYAGEEYADSMNLSQGKTQEQGVNTSNKVIDNITARSVSEIQSQAIQANQIKQNNDAYIEHQASETLNHNVASDTAQIQKNNVQLQQETISIFKKDFADAVKDKVMVMINQKLQQFDITLDPPEFGNMQVRVNLQGEQASVNFVVQNQQAKEALEQNMHKLRDMLAEQGVDVGGANVEQQDQQQNSNENDLGKGNNNASLLTSKEEENNVEHVLSAKLFDSSATGVDYYA